MPFYKYVANRFLTAFENLFLGIKLSEYHTGFRAFSRKVLLELPLLENSRRLCFRQSDAGAVRVLWLPHRRSLVPDEIFRGSFFHQFPAQREIRFGRAADDLAVCPAMGRLAQFRIFSAKGRNWSPDMPPTTRGERRNRQARDRTRKGTAFSRAA